MQQTNQSQSIETLILLTAANQLPETVFPREVEKLLSLEKLNLHEQKLDSIPSEIMLRIFKRINRCSSDILFHVK